MKSALFLPLKSSATLSQFLLRFVDPAAISLGIWIWISRAKNSYCFLIFCLLLQLRIIYFDLSIKSTSFEFWFAIWFACCNNKHSKQWKQTNHFAHNLPISYLRLHNLHSVFAVLRFSCSFSMISIFVCPTGPRWGTERVEGVGSGGAVYANWNGEFYDFYNFQTS